jgi:ABC-type branched-subunit amino acid transport system ATPase component
MSSSRLSSHSNSMRAIARAVHGLVFFLLLDVVGTLSPGVCATLVNAILTFESVKPSTLAHKQTLNTLMTLPPH